MDDADVKEQKIGRLVNGTWKVSLKCPFKINDISPGFRFTLRNTAGEVDEVVVPAARIRASWGGINQGDVIRVVRCSYAEMKAAYDAVHGPLHCSVAEVTDAMRMA